MRPLIFISCFLYACILIIGNTTQYADCYGVNVYTTPSNSYAEILMPNMMVLVGGALGRYLAIRAEPRKWTTALVKDTPERDPLPFSPCEDTMRRCWFQITKWTLTRRQPWWCLKDGLPVSRIVRNKTLPFISYPVCDIVSQWPE